MAAQKKTSPSFFGRAVSLFKKAFLKPPAPKAKKSGTSVRKKTAKKAAVSIQKTAFVPKKAARTRKKPIEKAVFTRKKGVTTPKKTPLFPLVSPPSVPKKKAVSKKKPAKKFAFVAAKHNPIIAPKSEHAWEAWQTFNPGVIELAGAVHFIYRAIGSDGVSRLGYASSSDGFSIAERLAHPVFEHRARPAKFNPYSYFSGGSFSGAEDPRLVRVGDEDTIYMTYTACDNGLRVGLASIKVRDFLQKKWKWNPSVIISPPGEVHKNWVIFPEKINGKYAILHSINPEVAIEYVDNLDFKDALPIKSTHGGPPRKDGWDKWVRGVGPVPLKTPHGWLVFYHAMDDDWGKYKVGAMLLDLNDPTKVLCRAKEPVLEPTEAYGNEGFKPGVVYAPGAVIRDGKLLLYYGVADSYAGVAHADAGVFLDELRKNMAPKARRKTT